MPNARGRRATRLRSRSPTGRSAVTYGDELPELHARASDLSATEIDQVVDLCFQCKLCYPNCPYTPPHEFAIDFPRLLLRWRRNGCARGCPAASPRHARPGRHRTGREPRAASRQRGAAQSANRLLMEKTIGVHRDKLMPTYTRDTFPRWWERHRPMLEPAEREGGHRRADADEGGAVLDMLIDFNDPEVGRAAVAVLEHNGVEVVRPPEQVCCGMPFLDGGDLDGATALIQRNVTAFTPFVDQGYAIVVPSPSCSLMVRRSSRNSSRPRRRSGSPPPPMTSMPICIG
jgi:Fe-S oxidoreductase